MIGSGIIAGVCWGAIAIGLVAALVRDWLRNYRVQHPKPVVARTADELEDLLYDRPVLRR